MNTPSRLMNSFHIAGFTYYEGPVVFEKINVGTLLNLEAEPDNRHDEYAVAIFKGNKKLGYIPKHFNKIVALLLQNGYDAFDAIVQQLDSKEHPEEQVRVGIYVKEKNS